MTVFEAFYADRDEKIRVASEFRGERKIVARMLSKGKTPEEISELTDIPLEEILNVQTIGVDA